MASFKLIERATGREIVINTAQFLMRNEYQVSDTLGVNWIDMSGYTTLQYKGDSIIDSLGWDDILQENEFYFENNPDYFLKCSQPKPLITSTTIGADPSALPNDFTAMRVDREYYGYLAVYKGASTTPLFQLIPLYRFKVYEYVSGKEIDDVIIPYSFNSTSLYYDPRVAFDFVHKQVAVVSPYYYQFPTFSASDQSLSLTTRPQRNLWVRPVELPDTGTYTFNNAPPALSNNYTVNKNTSYYYPTPRNFLWYNFGANYTSTVETYGQLSDKKIITSVTAYNSAKPSVIDHPTEDTLNWHLITYVKYDTLFDLLFDTIPEDDPDPYPTDPDDDTPDGQQPPDNGGDGDRDKGSDDIPEPPVPGINPIGMGAINLYQLDTSTYLQFLKYLWSNVFYTAILKLFQDPMECIISTHLIGANVPVSGSDEITIGNVTTTVKANIVPNNFISVDFGSLQLNEFYGDSSDYETVVQLYLPYYGTVTLNTHEVVKSTLHLTYNIDVLTGAFVAFLRVTKNVDGTSLDSILYQYNGNMAYQIPIGSTNYSNITAGLLSLVGNVATAGTMSAAKAYKATQSAVSDYLDPSNFSMSYQRSGSVSGNVGYMSVKNAYVVLLRPVHALPSKFAHYVGYPYMGYTSLGSCSGFTKCYEVYVDKIIGTPEETEMIKQALIRGILL